MYCQQRPFSCCGYVGLGEVCTYCVITFSVGSWCQKRQGCEHSCTTTHEGAVVCACREGYRLHSNGKFCIRTYVAHGHSLYKKTFKHLTLKIHCVQYAMKHVCSQTICNKKIVRQTSENHGDEDTKHNSSFVRRRERDCCRSHSVSTLE